MSSIENIVIVGAGLAGARAAEALRKEGFDGSITLLGDEPDRPYIRPPLSKEYLRGESERDAVYVHPETFYAEQRIDLRASVAARSIAPASREIILDRDGRVRFDRLLIATGARPRSLPVEGGDLPGVLTFRTLADADALRAAAAGTRAGRGRGIRSAGPRCRGGARRWRLLKGWGCLSRCALRMREHAQPRAGQRDRAFHEPPSALRAFPPRGSARLRTGRAALTRSPACLPGRR